MWKMFTVNTQAQCQNGEKWSFFGSLFVKARLGFHFVKNKHFLVWFWVSFLSKMEWKWNQEWSQEWMKNGQKRPTVNDPIRNSRDLHPLNEWCTRVSKSFILGRGQRNLSIRHSWQFAYADRYDYPDVRNESGQLGSFSVRISNLPTMKPKLSIRQNSEFLGKLLHLSIWAPRSASARRSKGSHDDGCQAWNADLGPKGFPNHSFH